MWPGNAFGCICLCVGNVLRFESFDLESSFLCMWVHLQNIQVRFLYQDHRVKVGHGSIKV